MTFSINEYVLPVRFLHKKTRCSISSGVIQLSCGICAIKYICMYQATTPLLLQYYKSVFVMQIITPSLLEHLESNFVKASISPPLLVFKYLQFVCIMQITTTLLSSVLNHHIIVFVGGCKIHSFKIQQIIIASLMIGVVKTMHHQNYHKLGSMCYTGVAKTGSCKVCFLE